MSRNSEKQNLQFVIFEGCLELSEIVSILRGKFIIHKKKWCDFVRFFIHNIFEIFHLAIIFETSLLWHQWKKPPIWTF